MRWRMNRKTDTHSVNTTAIPAGYLTSAKHRGRIEVVKYKTKDYTRNKNNTKPAYVYLPYGYDEFNQYDVLYMMHGWTMSAGDFFNRADHIIDVFDHLIEDQKIKPVIVVSLSFDAQNRSQDFSRSVEELSVFHKEFKNDVVPFIDTHYATNPPREHRLFTGFSLGAVTTWHQFVYNLDLVKYFIPMSGDCWIKGTYGGLYHPIETVDELERIVQHSQMDFMIYEGIGTSDPIFDQTDSQIQEMMTRSTFNQGQLTYGIKVNGYHDLVACREYLYNALPMMLKTE